MRKFISFSLDKWKNANLQYQYNTKNKLFTTQYLEFWWPTRWRSSESSSDKIEQRWAENRYTVRRCSDDGWQMKDDRWQMTYDRWRMTDDGSWMTDGRWKITDDRWWMTVGLQLLIKYKRLWDFHMIYRDLIDLILLWPLSNFGLSMSVSILRCLSTL